MRYHLLAALLALAPIGQAQAATFVVAGYATTAGGAGVTDVFGTTAGPYKTNQIGFSAATLAQSVGALPIGATVTGIAFRLGRGFATVTSDISFDQFDISIGQSANAMGSLVGTFAANLGQDTILARSGALTIAGGSLTKGSTSSRPGAFYNLAFDTPYTYVGGDLLLTIDSHLTSQLASGAFQLDAFSTVPYTRVDVNSTFNLTAPKPFGYAHSTYQPVVQLTYSLAPAVPEPATWAMMIVGFGMVGGAARHRRRRTCVAYA